MTERHVATRGAGEASLRRELGVFLGVVVVVNATIGTGIFRIPAKVARSAGTLPAALGAWVAGAVIALCGALTLAELAAAIPRTGGLYEYIRRAYGPGAAFLVGWTKLTLLIPSATGSFARLASESLASLAGLRPNAARETAVAVAILAGCAGANVVGVRASATQQAVVTSLKYAGVLLLAAAGLALPFAPPAEGASAAAAGAPAFATGVTATGLFAALVSVMWAYDGWADLSSLAGETRDPGRTLPRALVLGTLAICVVYLAANLGYARVLGIDGLRASTSGDRMVAANVAEATMGGAGRRVVSFIVLASCVGGCMASLMTGARMFVPMATDGLFVRWLGAVSERTGAPSRAVVVGAALGAVYLTWRSFEQLTEAFVVGYFPFYMLAVGAVFVLRRREPGLSRPFRVPGYPVVPVVFLAGATALLVGALADADRNAYPALAVMAAGVPVGWAWRRRRRERAA